MKRLSPAIVSAVGQQRNGGAIPVTMMVKKAVLQSKGNTPRSHKDTSAILPETTFKKNWWSWNHLNVSVPKHRPLTEKGKYAKELKHHHSGPSAIALANMQDYSDSVHLSKSRNFLAPKEPIPDHPLHPKIADPMEVRAFHERYYLDCRQIVNTNPKGYNPIVLPYDKKPVDAKAAAAATPQLKK